MITDVILAANDGMASESESVCARLVLYRKLHTSLKRETISNHLLRDQIASPIGNCCACLQRLFGVYQNTARDGIA